MRVVPKWKFYRETSKGKYTLVTYIHQVEGVSTPQIGDKVRLVPDENIHSFFLITDRIVHFYGDYDVTVGDIDFYVRFCNDATLIQN